jgi:hypothetical protein
MRFPVHAVDAEGTRGRRGILEGDPGAPRLPLAGSGPSRTGAVFLRTGRIAGGAGTSVRKNPEALEESLEALALGIRHGKGGGQRMLSNSPQ